MKCCKPTLLLCLVLSAPNALAAVVTVTPSPTQDQISADRPSSVSIAWQVTTNANALAVATERVSSPLGTFVTADSGQFLGTVGRPIGQSTNTGAATVREQLVVPLSIVTAARQLGSRQIIYRRAFDSNVPPAGPPVTAEVVLGISGGLSGEFALRSISLRFEDNRRVNVFAPDAATHVLADIAFTGSGRLEAVWEVAEPGSTKGFPAFRVLQLVRRQLTGSGRQFTLRSPPIPTQDAGLYLVRLRVTQPDTFFEEPIIRYFINPGLKPEAPIQQLRLGKPNEGSVLARQTQFSWDPVAGAQYYRLEIYPTGNANPSYRLPSLGAGTDLPERPVAPEADQRPISGALISADTPELVLSDLSFSHLERGRQYLWRVQAFDEYGRLIGESPLRRTLLP